MDVDDRLVRKMLQIVEDEGGIGEPLVVFGAGEEYFPDRNQDEVRKHAVWLKDNGLLDVHSVNESAGVLPTAIQVAGLTPSGEKELKRRTRE